MEKIINSDAISNFLMNNGGKCVIKSEHLQIHFNYDCGCKIVSESKKNKAIENLFPCQLHKSELYNLNVPENKTIDEFHYPGFKSSLNEFPPYKTPIVMIDKMGVNRTVVLHESENDGYDFLSERPLRVHLIMDKTINFKWKLLNN